MKKSDLENGMIVECENGSKYMVVRNFNKYANILFDETREVLMGIDEGSNYMPLSKYNEDLKLNRKDIFGYNIAKVGYPEHISYPIGANIVWIWERKVTLTEDEKIILKNINKRYKWIARSYETLWVFEDKPYKRDCGEAWDYNYAKGRRDMLRPFNHLFAFIKSTDMEPYSIDDLLKQNGVER